MKYFKSSSIFDSFRFFYYLSKFGGYLFFTVKKDKLGKYYSATTVLDIMVFVTSLMITLTASWNIVKTPFKLSSRSIVLDLGVFMLTKMIVLNINFSTVQNFFNRHENFEIIGNFHFIDKKVKLIKIL